MPRMSKKRKNEFAFFLNDRGRRAYNELCRKCQHECKQSFRACLLNEILTDGIQDSNGILFIRFPIMELSAVLSRSPMTVKRSLNELEQAGMIMRVRQGIGEANHIYILLPKEGIPDE